MIFFCRFILIAYIINVIAFGCGTRPNRREEELEQVNHSIKSISEEYRRLEKACNELQLKIEYRQSYSVREADEIRVNIRNLRLSTINLISEGKAKLIEKENFDSMLAKEGFNMMLIQELDKRVKELSREFESNFYLGQQSVTIDTLY